MNENRSVSLAVLAFGLLAGLSTSSPVPVAATGSEGPLVATATFECEMTLEFPQVEYLPTDERCRGTGVVAGAFNTGASDAILPIPGAPFHIYNIAYQDYYSNGLAAGWGQGHLLLQASAACVQGCSSQPGGIFVVTLHGATAWVRVGTSLVFNIPAGQQVVGGDAPLHVHEGELAPGHTSGQAAATCDPSQLNGSIVAEMVPLHVPNIEPPAMPLTMILAGEMEIICT